MLLREKSDMFHRPNHNTRSPRSLVSLNNNEKYIYSYIYLFNISIYLNMKTILWKVSPTGFNLAWEFRWILGQES